MTDPEDPPRLVDSGAPSELSALLQAARADVGTERQVSAVGAALAPHFAVPSAAAPAAAKAAMSAVAKVSIAAVAVAVGASATYFASSRGHAPSSSSAPPAAIAPVTPAVVLPVAPPSDNGEAPRADAPLASGSHTPSLTPHLEASTEADLLGQAQAALAGDPSRALSLAERHQKRFPNGVLVQEREVIAIEALARLGRKTAAEARAARFLRAFPTSAHRSKIESIVSGR